VSGLPVYVMMYRSHRNGIRRYFWQALRSADPHEGVHVLVGHLATALAARRFEPKLSLGVTLAGAFGLDLLWPILLLTGAESVSIHPGDTAVTNLSFDHYPWSHGLAPVLAWSVIAGLVARRVTHSARAGLVMGSLVTSHWVLDFIVHRPDLPLWPGGPRVGLDLWHSVALSMAVEGTLLLAGLWYYLRGTRRLDAIGVWAPAALVALIGVLWATQPIAPLPPSGNAVAWSALVMWILLPWGNWIDRHRAPIQV